MPGGEPGEQQEHGPRDLAGQVPDDPEADRGEQAGPHARGRSGKGGRGGGHAGQEARGGPPDTRGPGQSAGATVPAPRASARMRSAASSIAAAASRNAGACAAGSSATRDLSSAPAASTW